MDGGLGRRWRRPEEEASGDGAEIRVQAAAAASARGTRWLEFGMEDMERGRR